MKNWKLSLPLALILVVMFASCSKRTLPVKTMTVAELKATEKIDLIKLWDDAYGQNGTQRNAAKKPNRPNDATLVTVQDDLGIEETSPGVITGDVSPDAYVAGGQNFSDTTSNTAAIGLWGCNRSYSSPPGAGATTTCSTERPGWCRVFSADFVTYAVHKSKFILTN